MAEFKIKYDGEHCGWTIETETHYSEKLSYDEMLSLYINVTGDADNRNGNRRYWLKPKPKTDVKGV